MPRRALLGIALFGTALALLAGVALAAAGQLDHSFSSDGKQTFGFQNGNRDDTAFDVALDGAGRAVLAGFSNQGPPNGDAFALARLKVDGNLDEAFSTDGRRTIDFANSVDEAQAMAIQSDGRIVAAGFSDQGSARDDDFAIARLRPGGGLDATFSGDGKRTLGFGDGTGVDDAYGVAIQRDGRIVVVGTSDAPTAGSHYKIALARLKPGGALDKTFSQDGKRTLSLGPGTDDAEDLAIRRDGRIVLVGFSFQGAATGDDAAVVRLNPNGSLDHSFSGDGKRIFRFAPGTGTDQALGLAIEGTRIVVAGESDQPTSGTDFAIARLKPDGSLDHSFSNDGKRTFGFLNGAGFDAASDVAIQSDGKIVAAGLSGQGVATGDDLAIARLTPGGALDTGFSGDGRRTIGFNDGDLGDEADGVAIQGNGRIVAAGDAGYGNFPATTDFAIARLLGG